MKPFPDRRFSSFSSTRIIRDSPGLTLESLNPDCAQSGADSAVQSPRSATLHLIQLISGTRDRRRTFGSDQKSSDAIRCSRRNQCRCWVRQARCLSFEEIFVEVFIYQHEIGFITQLSQFPHRFSSSFRCHSQKWKFKCPFVILSLNPAFKESTIKNYCNY